MPVFMVLKTINYFLLAVFSFINFINTKVANYTTENNRINSGFSMHFVSFLLQVLEAVCNVIFEIQTSTSLPCACIVGFCW